MRLFFALPLPESLQASLADWQQGANQAGLAAAYPRPEGLHLTLVFLGEVESDRVPALGRVGQELSFAVEPFTLRTAGLGRFPAQGLPKVLWLGVEPSLSLHTLQRSLALALEPLGFRREARPYAPHLTLARPRRRPSVPLPEAPCPFEWRASELVLYESCPAPGGQRYEVLRRWPFRASRLPTP